MVCSAVYALCFVLRDNRRARALRWLTALDQWLFSVATLGHSHSDETASAAAYRLERAGKWQGRVFRPVIDLLFLPWERDHCAAAYLAEINRDQLPSAYHL